LKPAYRTLENENAGFGFNPIEDSLARGDLNIFSRFSATSIIDFIGKLLGTKHI
jgi:hypothetical protein